ncbi:MAG TPA: glycosyltransferase [Blastocatellia bacterium]|nr:glycosyltransferase [Blastocatellia bacterium]
MKRSVLQLVSSFHQGGSERQAIQLARLLKESGRYNVSLACLDSNGVLRDEAERLELGHIPEYRLTSFYDRNMVVQLRLLARFLRQREINIVHTHDFYTNVFGMAAAKMARVPVRIASRRETTGWRTQAQKFVERLSYRMAHCIVANAEAVRGQLVEEGVRAEKIVTIYNGLDMQRIKLRPGLSRADILASFDLQQHSSNRFVTIVANLRHPVKDHPTFLRAASRVYQSAPHAQFVIAGEGELIKPMKELAGQLGLERVTHFIGRCDRVAELLAVSDVCVLSSKAEGFSNSILEYMAAGRPVVVTDVGGAREAVIDNETGYLVPAGDDEAMAQRITRLLEQPEMAQAMGRKGQKRIEENFSCRAQLEREESLYERLLRPSHRRPSQVLDNVAQ